LPQYWSGLQFLALALLAYTRNGAVARRDGNRDPVAVPHGCYPCVDGRWVVVSCWDDEEWSRFRGVTGWEDEERFATAGARRANEDLLNARIADWTRTQDARHVMHRLQSCGVHAAAVNTMKDLFSDP